MLRKMGDAKERGDAYHAGTRSARNCGASKDLPWRAVRKARELELKYLRDLGVYGKVDENEAVAQYQVTPVDTKWVDTDKAFEGEPMHIRSRIVARKFKSDDRPDLYAGTLPLEALKIIISIAANHKETFSFIHIDVSRAYFHAEAQRHVCADTITCGGQNLAPVLENMGLLKKSMYGPRDAASNWERDWQEHVKRWSFQLGLSWKETSFRMTHGDDFVLTGPTERLTEFENKMTGVYPIKAKVISYGSSESIKTLDRRLHWRRRGVV